jgi:hypothetical protein
MVTVHHKTNVSVEELKKRLVEMSKIRVMVGITADDTERKEEGINNASLLYIQTHGARRKSMRDEMQQKMDEGYKYSEAFSMYIHSHGSPLWQIPPRPVLEPAIKDCKDKIAKRLTKAFKAAIQGDKVEMERWFDSAGMYAEKYSRNWFENPKNHWPPNAPSTIARKGSDVPLIDTGELRKAIKHVIRRVK